MRDLQTFLKCAAIVVITAGLMACEEMTDTGVNGTNGSNGINGGSAPQAPPSSNAPTPVVGTIGEPITDTSQLPQSLPGEGEMTKRDLMIGGCRADWVRVVWDFYAIFGSPVVFGNYEWDGDRNCTPHHQTIIWYKAEGSNGGFGYIGESPVVPEAGAGLGFNSPSAPNWNDLLCGFKNHQKTECLGEDSAKQVYRLSKVTDFVIGWPLE